jgi:23S rRNA (uracil1939-C5)-methyltransferase
MVRGRAAVPRIGIFEAGTHTVVDIPECRTHHPLVNRVAAAVREAVRLTGTAPYDEVRHCGTLRAVQVVVERASQTAQVVLVANGVDPDVVTGLAAALGAGLEPLLHSLWWNGQPERTNVILGPHWHPFRGPEAVCEEIGGARIFFPPGAFGQSHLELADRLVRRVQAQVPDGARVAEYYAGCGAIGLGLLRRAARGVFVESAPDAVHGLALGLAARPAAERARAAVIAGTAADAVEAAADADVVLVDPPRKGLDAPLAAALAAAPPRRLLYVSCDLDSFERDAARLHAGGARLAALDAFALFPGTEHVETVARFER